MLNGPSMCNQQSDLLHLGKPWLNITRILRAVWSVLTQHLGVHDHDEKTHGESARIAATMLCSVGYPIIGHHRVDHAVSTRCMPMSWEEPKQDISEHMYMQGWKPLSGQVSMGHHVTVPLWWDQQIVRSDRTIVRGLPSGRLKGLSVIAEPSEFLRLLKSS